MAQKFHSDIQLIGSSTDLSLQDGGIIKLGTDVDFKMQHNGTNTFLENYTGALYIDQNTNDGSIIFRNDDGSGGLTSYIQIKGSSEETLFTKKIRLNDSVEAHFGTARDLKIYHDGSHSFIKDSGTGHLKIQGSNLKLQDVDGTNYIDMIDGDYVKLFFNGSAKLETTNVGVTITGTANSNALYLYEGDFTMHGGSSGQNDIRWINTWGNWRIEVGDGANNFKIHSESLNADYLTLEGGGQLTLNEYGSGTFTGTAAYNLAVTSSGEVIEVTGGGSSDTAERIEVTVKNVSGGSLSKGTVVHASPSATPPSGNVIEVIAADYDDATKMPAIGILNETIADEAEGAAVMMGAVSGIATSSFSIGDELYVGNNGTLTNTKPATAGQLIQKIAVVIKSHASNGLIKIFGAGRSNDVPLPLHIDNTNQRVGIGTTTPTAPLHIEGGTTSEVLKVEADTSPFIRWVQNGTNVGFLQFTGGTAYLSNMANSSFRFRTNNTDKMTITAGGSVGIGTTSPVKPLHISDSNPIIRLSDSDATTTSAINSWIEWYRGNNTERAGYIGYASTSNPDLYIKNEITTGDVVLAAGDTERMRIDSSGYIKIGQDVGGSAFNGASVLQLSPYTSGQPVYIGLKSDTSSNCGILMGDSDDSYVGGFIYNNANNYLVVNTNNAERMRITSDGALLVGDSVSPSTVWDGVGVFGKNGTKKVIVGYLDTTPNENIVGGHNSALDAWDNLTIAGTEIKFRTSTSITERMRITSAGDLVINSTTSSPLSSLFSGTLVVKGKASQDPIIAITDSGTANAAAAVFHQSSTSPGFPAVVINAASTGSEQPLISGRVGVSNTTGIGGTEVFKVDGDGDATFAGNITITGSGSANSASLQIDNPDSNSFNHSIEAFAANLTSGESNVILVGKEGNTKNSGYIGYYWTASGSNNNFVSLGHWAADHLFRVYGDSVLSTVTLRSDVDMQAPIFYDKDNTGYYINPASRSNFGSLDLNSSAVWDVTTQGASKGALHLDPASSTDHAGGSITWGASDAGGGQSAQAGIYVRSDGSYGTRMYFSTTDSYATGSKTAMNIQQNGQVNITRSNLIVHADVRTQIFYDSNNTNYFIDPASNNSIKTVGDWRSDSSTWTGEFAGKMQYHSNWWYIQTSNGVFVRNASGSNNIELTAGGTGIAAADWRAPIFYDSNNTNFYAHLDNSGGNTSINAAGVIRGNWFVASNYTSTGYTIYKGYDNWNHFISVRGHCRPGQSKTQAAILGGHQTSFVEYAENNATTGWFFIGSAGSTYEEIAKITKDFAQFTQARAPIFYDSNDTNYYVNPNSTSRIRRTDLIASGSGWDDGLNLYSNDATNRWNLLVDDGASDMFRIAYNNSEKLRLQTNGEVFTLGTGKAGSDYRAPIFYDSDNTGRYVDPHATSVVYKIQAVYGSTTGSTAPGYSGTALEVITSGNQTPAIGFHRGGYSATTLYEYDGELYVNPWTTRAQSGKLLSSGNWGSYVFNGTWNGANFPGSRWGGFSVNTGEIAFQRDNPNNGQMSIMVDGNFYAGENNGFWSLYSGNSYNSKIGWVSNSSGDFAVSGGTRNLKQLNAIYDNNTTFYLDLDGTSKVYTIEDDHGNEMYTRHHSGSDFANGTLVVTDITSNTQHGDSFVLEATGKSYSSDPPFSFMVQGYLYNYTIINHSGIHYGKPGFTTMKVFDYNGVLAFWWPRVSYWNSFDVHVRDAGGHTRNRVTSISNSTEPSSSKKVSVTMRASSIYGYNPGTSYATNAYAQVYYDTDNTVYKLDPHSTSVVNTVHFGNNTNNGFISGYGTYSLNIARVAQMSLDWNANYNSPSNHGIMSTDSVGNFADSVSINSYNDITLRLDSNNNNSASALRVKDGTSGTGNDIFTINQAAQAELGRNGMNPWLRLMYVDSGSGNGWDTSIHIGRTDDLPNGTSFPTYTATGGYGIQFQANSDGVFYGMKQYTSGHYRPYINWGDDTSDSPMEIAYNGSTKYSFTYDGSFTAVGNGAFSGGYLYLSSGNSIFSPSGGVIQTASNFYAARFYAYGNTTYYADIDNMSYFNALLTGGTIQAGTGGTGNIYLGNTGLSGSGNHFRFHTNNSHTYFDGNCGDIHWRQGSSTRFIFYMTTANMTVNGTVTQYSDSRLKENIVTIDSALNKVNQLRGVYYNRTDINTSERQIGLIAQEVESIVPEVVHTADDDLNTKSISYAQLNALLVEAIKELKADNDSLRARIETLENS